MNNEHKKWIQRLQRVIKDAPDDIWLFCASNTLNVMKKENGERVINENGSMAESAVLATIKGVEVDGGDW